MTKRGIYPKVCALKAGFLISCIVIFFCATLLAQTLPNTPTGKFPPGIDLPEGDNRALLLRACTACHDLKGVPAYKGYWNRQQWLAMVNTMVQHGASLDKVGAGKVADYLNEHFGKK